MAIKQTAAKKLDPAKMMPKMLIQLLTSDGNFCGETALIFSVISHWLSRHVNHD
jgi:hypothetical protein